MMENTLTMLMCINKVRTNEYSMNVDMDRMWEKVTDWIGRMLRRFPQLKEERKSEKQNRKKLYLMVQKRKIKS